MTLRLRAFLALVTVIGLTVLASVGPAQAHENDWDTWPIYRKAHMPKLLPKPDLPADEVLHGSAIAEWEVWLDEQERLDRLRDKWEAFDAAWEEAQDVGEPVVAAGGEGSTPATAVSSGPYPGVPLCPTSCISCETGGTFDPQIVSPSGTYWGLFQFDYQTWTAPEHGGNPDSYGSAGASEQHAVAARVSYDAWPNC